MVLELTEFVIPSNYVDQATAQSLGLVSVSGTTFTMRADDTTVLTPSGPGRNSVRIRSNAEYTTHVAVYVILRFCNSQRCTCLPVPIELTPATCHKDAVHGLLSGKPQSRTGPTRAKLTLYALERSPLADITLIRLTASVFSDTVQ